MVYQVLEMLAAGYNEEEILSEFPSLSKEHMKAALEYASKRLSERIVELT